MFLLSLFCFWFFSLALAVRPSRLQPPRGSEREEIWRSHDPRGRPFRVPGALVFPRHHPEVLMSINGQRGLQGLERLLPGQWVLLAAPRPLTRVARLLPTLGALERRKWA